jgi:hypothetical protein
MEDREATQGHTPEEIIAKLPQVDVLVPRGQSVADAVRSISSPCLLIQDRT